MALNMSERIMYRIGLGEYAVVLPWYAEESNPFSYYTFSAARGRWKKN